MTYPAPRAGAPRYSELASGGTSTACCRSTSSGTICRTASLVDASTTGAATPAAWARAQFTAVTH